MSLVELYYKLEEKWFAFVDSVSEKGIPLDKVADKLEQAGVPTFPLLITILLFAIYFSVLFIVPEQKVPPTMEYYSLTVQVTDQDGKPVQGALVIIGKKENYTDSAGEATFRLKEGNYTVKISKSGCENTTREISVFENKVLPVILTCAKVIFPKTMKKTLILKTPEGVLIDNGYAYVYKKGKETPETYRIEDGKVKIPLDENVWKVEIVGEDMRCTKTLYQDDLFGNESVLDITLNCEEPTEETVTITVQVVDESDNPIKDVPVKIENREGRQITITKTTNQDGIVEFDGITKGIDITIIAGPYGEYKESRVEINTEEKQEVRIVLTKAKKSTLSVITVLNESGSPVKHASIIIYMDNKTINKGTTDSKGTFRISLDRNRVYKVTVYKDGYYTSDEIRGGQSKTIVLNMTKEIAFGSLTVYVYLQLESGDLKTPKNTYVYLKDSNGVRLCLEKEVKNGVVRFEELPVGTYIPVVVRNGVETPGESVEIQEDSIKTVRIYLQPLEFQLIVYVEKDSKPVPGAHVVLYQGDTQVSETTTEIDGAAYFFVKEQLDYTIEAEKEIEGVKYIGKEEINGYEITQDLEKTIELVSPDYDVIYKGVSEYPGGPFQKGKPLDILKKYYLDFQVTPPNKDERVEITFESENVAVIAIHSDLEDVCDFQISGDEITVENCSEEDISEIKFYIEPKELGVTKPKLTAKFYFKDELMKKKKITVELNITTTCKVIDNKYICLKVDGTRVGVITQPYNVTYELKTNYGAIDYEHTCSEETGSISEEHGKITVTPLKSGECFIIFKANGMEITKHKYEVTSVECEVELEPSTTYVNGETSIKINEIFTSPQLEVKEAKVKNVDYPSDDYSGITKGEIYSEGDFFKLLSGKKSGKIRITWSIEIPETGQENPCLPSQINVEASPLKIITKKIETPTEKLLLKNTGNQTIEISDVSLVYPEEEYEVSLNCFDEDLDGKVSPEEKYTCKINEKIIEKLSEYSQGETKKIWVFVEYQDSESNEFTHKEQITFNVELCKPGLKIVLSPTLGVQGEDIKVKLVSAKFVNRFCKEKDVEVNLTECNPGLCTPGTYKAGDVVLKLNGSDTAGLNETSLTFEYNKSKNTTKIVFIQPGVLQVKLSTNLITINKDNLIDPYNGKINVNITLESATFNGKEVKVKLNNSGGTGAPIKEYRKGDKIKLTKLPKTDSTTLEWAYYDTRIKRWYTNITTITFKVSGKLKVSVHPDEVDANETSAELNVNATFEGIKTTVILENCVPKELCEASLGKKIKDKVVLSPDKAKDYSYAYLYWKLEVPKGSQRVFKDETRIKIINSTCGEFVTLKTTTLMRNEKNKYTIEINTEKGTTPDLSCENATCSIKDGKLVLENVKENTNTVYVKFKKGKCIAPFIIHILSRTEYYGKFYSTVPKVVDLKTLESITKPDSPKEIAEKFNNRTTYHGEYFNNQYFLAKLVAEILKKSDNILENVFKKDQYAKKCVDDLTKNFQTCKEIKEGGKEKGFVLETVLRNISIGYVSMTNESFNRILSKLVTSQSFKNIAVPEGYQKIYIPGKTITCGVYDMNIVLNCTGESGKCKVEKIEFKKVKDVSCDATVNNFPLFIGQTQIANPPEGDYVVDCTKMGLSITQLYTNFSGSIGKFYEQIIGMYDSCKRLKWGINDYSMIYTENGSLSPPRNENDYPNLIYIIPDDWVNENVPQEAKYGDFINNAIQIYKQNDPSVLVMYIERKDGETLLFLVGNISKLNTTLSNYYRQNSLNASEIENDGKVLIIGRGKAPTKPKKQTKTSTESLSRVVFLALTNCGGLKEGESKEFNVIADEELVLAKCDSSKIGHYSTKEKCLQSGCSGDCLKILCTKNKDGTWDKITIKKVKTVIEWLNSEKTYRFTMDWMGPSINFLYEDTYYTDSDAKKSVKGDDCDPECENAKSVIGKNCHDNRFLFCNLLTELNTKIKKGKKYKVTMKYLGKKKYDSYTGVTVGVCKLTVNPA